MSKAVSGFCRDDDDSLSGTNLDELPPPIVDDAVGAPRKPVDDVGQPAELPERELFTVEYGAGGLEKTKSSAHHSLKNT